MTDFADLLNQNMDEVEAPQPLPVGNWILQIDTFENIESSQKQTPGTQFTFKVISPSDGVNAEDLEGLDYSRKTLRTTFWLTPDAKHRLKDFLEKAGCNITGRTFAQVLPESVGMQVVGYIVQRPSNNPGDKTIYNDISSFSRLP